LRGSISRWELVVNRRGGSLTSSEYRPPPPEGNSRESAVCAGWRDNLAKPADANWKHLLDERKRTKWGNFTWISPAPLLASMNDQVVKGLDDLVNALRPRWIASLRRGDYSRGRLTIHPFPEDDERHERFSFLVLGDPGEQDASQYAVVAPLIAKGQVAKGETGEEGQDTSFMVICSDVIYPAGDINDYIDGFYLPFRGYRAPIYALPGNHDWYDGLNGFMFHFCGAEPLPPVAYRAGSYSWKERFARVLWRKPSPPDLPAVLHERDLFVKGDWKPVQPGPYHAIATKSLMIVSIDTGITGKLDAEQGEWLRRVSCDPRAKVLLTGKPLYVDGEYHPGEIDWDESEGRPDTVDDIVRDPEHRYVAAIGGDVHNYQRYSVNVLDDPSNCSDDSAEPSKRRIEYLVSGGGGAYLSATHRFGRVNLKPELKEHPVERIAEGENFWCYPLRGDSLARFTRRFAPGLGAWLITAILALFGAWLYLFLFDGKDQSLGPIKHIKVWETLYATPLTLIAVAVTLLLAVKISNSALPWRYRTLAATTLAVAIGAGLVLLLNLVLGEEEWADLRRLMFSSLISLVVPVLGVVGYFLFRDFLAPSVRVGIALAVPIGICTIAVAKSGAEIPVEGATLTAGALVTLWIFVAVIAHLRDPPGLPNKHKLRVRVGRLLPPLLGAAGVVTALYSIADDNFLAAGVLSSFAAIVVMLALLLLVIGWRGLRAALWIFPGRIDPDQASSWIASKLGIDAERKDAREIAKIKWKTKALASLTYKTWPFTKVMSELAEATRPPFFKNFLRIEVQGSQMTIKAYGVSGWGDEETNPTLEDEIKILLPPREAEAGTIGSGQEPRPTGGAAV
jgi:hypothetical protein